MNAEVFKSYMRATLTARASSMVHCVSDYLRRSYHGKGVFW